MDWIFIYALFALRFIVFWCGYYFNFAFDASMGRSIPLTAHVCNHVMNIFCCCQIVNQFFAANSLSHGPPLFDSSLLSVSYLSYILIALFIFIYREKFLADHMHINDTSPNNLLHESYQSNGRWSTGAPLQNPPSEFPSICVRCTTISTRSAYVWSTIQITR